MRQGILSFSLVQPDGMWYQMGRSARSTAVAKEASLEAMRVSIRFLLGVILLAMNQPFGWGAVVVCTVLAVKTHRPMFYLMGPGGYALSWGMLGLGVASAGPQGIPSLCDLLGKIWAKTHCFEAAHRLRQRWRHWRRHW
jgi:hypothetical protein